jgi:hypothetical protein
MQATTEDRTRRSRYRQSCWSFPAGRRLQGSRRSPPRPREQLCKSGRRSCRPANPARSRPKLKREEQRRDTTVEDQPIGENNPLAPEPEELRTNSCSRGKPKMTQLTKGVVPGINFPEEVSAGAWLESSSFRASELVGDRTVFEQTIAAPRRHFYSGLLSVSRGKSKLYAEGAVWDRLHTQSRFLSRGALSRNRFSNHPSPPVADERL